MDEVFTQIQELKKKFVTARQDFQDEISSWEKDFKLASAKANLGENKIIKMLLQGLKDDIDSMNKVLLFDESVTDSERQRIFDRRALYQKIVGFFEIPKSTVERIKKQIKENL